MASVKRSIVVHASAEVVWEIIRDVGALHTRLVPGFVVDTQIEGETRLVTFGNGMVVREPIVTLDDDEMRLAWGAEGAGLDHYNGAVDVTALPDGCRITWRADFLPHDKREHVAAMIDQGMAVMEKTLNALDHSRPKRSELPEEATNEMTAIARLAIREGKLDEFKRLAGLCVRSVQTKDSGTLQYDYFFNDDQTECVVVERYRNLAAFREHLVNIGGDLMQALLGVCSMSGDILTAPTPELRQMIAGFDIRLYSPYQPPGLG